jgi:hypothetical protein
MAAVRAKKRTAVAANRLINRELSFFDYDARVLALAQDSDLPLLERVRFCSIFSHMLDDFFHDADRGPERPGCGGHHRSLARRENSTAGATRSARARPRAAGRSGAGVVGRAVPCTRERGHRHRARRRSFRVRAVGARAALRARHLPGAHPARGWTRSAVPVHLRPLDQSRGLRARPGERPTSSTTSPVSAAPLASGSCSSPRSRCGSD